MQAADNNKKLFWLKLVNILAALCGFGVALAILIGPLGVWLNLWTFRTAFSILGAVYPFTRLAAIAIGVCAVSLSAVALLYDRNTAMQMLRLPLLACVACVLAWYIPSTYQAPPGMSYPPIHDVSTDVTDVPVYVAILPLRADAPNSVIYGNSPNMTAERNAQLQQEAFPDLVTQHYQESEAVIFQRALAAVDEMGWELVDASEADGRIEATATTFWLRFKDDVVIRIRSADGETLVDARSLSRVGGGDAGTNGKRLQKFFALMQP